MANSMCHCLDLHRERVALRRRQSCHSWQNLRPMNSQKKGRKTKIQLVSIPLEYHSGCASTSSSSNLQSRYRHKFSGTSSGSFHLNHFQHIKLQLLQAFQIPQVDLPCSPEGRLGCFCHSEAFKAARDLDTKKHIDLTLLPCNYFPS